MKMQGKIKKQASLYADIMLDTNFNRRSLIEEAYIYAYKEAIYKAIEVARSYQSFDIDTSLNIASELSDIIIEKDIYKK